MLFDQGRGADNIMPISVWVITHQKKKGGLPHGFAFPIAMSKFCDREIGHPVILLVVDEEPQIGLYPLVVMLRLPIRLGVVGHGDVLLNAQCPTQFLDKFGCESGISVTDELVGKPIVAKDLFHEELRCLFGRDSFVAGYEPHQLGAAVISDGENGIISSREWQLSYEV